MKNCLLSFAALLTCFSLTAQCLPQGITLYTQQEVNAFATNYPNCTEIEGDLYVGTFGTDITDLSPLSNLEKIGGTLTIENLDNVDDLSPLYGITEIGVNFSINRCAFTELDFPNLISVGDNMQLQDNDSLVILDGFQMLESIGGNLLIYNNSSLREIKGSNQLKSTGRQLSIYLNEKLEIISGFDGLECVTEQFGIFDHSILDSISGFNSLNKIGSFLFTRNWQFEHLNHFDAIEKVDEDFTIRNNNDLLEIKGFASLDTIGEGFLIENNQSLTLIEAFNSLVDINDDLLIRNNNVLLELKGFESIITINNQLSINENSMLQSITGFSSLINVIESLNLRDNFVLSDLSGFSNVQSTGGLNLSRNYELQIINAFNQLSHCDGNFVISNNDDLQNLDAFFNLKEINGFLHIEYNDIIQSIEGISNIDPYSINSPFGSVADISILGNGILSQCSVQSVCRTLLLPDRRVTISTNAMGCQEASDLDCNTRFISGYVYFDTNEDGDKDDNEFGIPNQLVQLLPDDTEVLSDQNGLFFFFVEEDSTYQINWIEHPDWSYINGVFSYDNVTLDEFNNGITFNFGLKPNFSVAHAEIFVASDQTRCNENGIIHLRYHNVGTFPLSGTISLNYDANCTFNSSLPEANDLDILNQNIVWEIENLEPFEYREIVIDLEMPDETFTGDTLLFVADLMMGPNQDPIVQEQFQYSSLVRCSFDPNDKLANPFGQGEQNLIEPNTQMTYTVRFQNTGNAEAINIFIEDTIDANLNMESFQVVNSSFPVRTVIDGNAVKFNFDNIYLPDSLSNEPKSHGFVTYQINPAANLPDPSTIYNEAFIYFDQNPPIQTNLTESTLGTPVSSNVEILDDLDWEIAPNPAGDFAGLNWKEGLSANGQLVMMDISGKEISAFALSKNQKELRINLTNVESGIYFLQLNIDGNIKTQKLIVQ